MAAIGSRTHAHAHPRRAAAGRAGTAIPRRVSGPVARPLRPAAVPGGRPGTGAFERVRALPDHRVVDGLLRSRAWIVLIALMLGGIVAMQVSLLKLNAGISRAVETTATLTRQNADMKDSIARLSSGERVRDAALASGMVAPPAGEIGFLRSRGERDAQLAARRLQPPSVEAQAVMSSPQTVSQTTTPAG